MALGSKKKIGNSKGKREEVVILVDSSIFMPSFKGLFLPLIPKPVFFVEQRFPTG